MGIIRVDSPATMIPAGTQDVPMSGGEPATGRAIFAADGHPAREPIRWDAHTCTPAGNSNNFETMIHETRISTSRGVPGTNDEGDSGAASPTDGKARNDRAPTPRAANLAGVST